MQRMSYETTVMSLPRRHGRLKRDSSNENEPIYPIRKITTFTTS